MAISVPNLFLGRVAKLGGGRGKLSIKIIFISMSYDMISFDSNHGFNSPLFLSFGSSQGSTEKIVKKLALFGPHSLGLLSLISKKNGSQGM